MNETNEKHFNKLRIKELMEKLKDISMYTDIQDNECTDLFYLLSKEHQEIIIDRCRIPIERTRASIRIPKAREKFEFFDSDFTEIEEQDFEDPIRKSIDYIPNTIPVSESIFDFEYRVERNKSFADCFEKVRSRYFEEFDADN